MSRVSSIVNILREDGLEELGRKIGYYTIKNSPAAPHLQSILGEILSEKFLIYMSSGYWPQFKPPRSFNEHVAHRKLFTDKEVFSTVSDKWSVREYVADRVGEEFLNTVYHVTDNPDTIPFDELPEKFVVKATHTSGQNTIIDDKSRINFDEIRADCREWLSQMYGEMTREYWYANIEPKILVEKRLRGSSGDIPRDYKFFVFDSQVEFIQVDLDRFESHTRCLYDTDWQKMDIRLEYPQGRDIDSPPHFDEMMDIAELLGEEFEFVRVDLYDTPEGPIFGELTLAPGAGYEKFEPIVADFEIGSNWPQSD